MPPPNLELTFRDGGTGDAGDPYTGLDRFGRLVETLWKQSGTGDARVQSQYGRNEVGGVVWRKDEQAHTQGVPTEDNYYWYDALQQVKERQRGELTDPASSTPICDVQQEEDWTYDATGNWTSYSNPSPDSAHTQTRTQNTANEITQIARVSGGATVEPSYDPAGNMLTLPKEPGISTDQYALKWDAWNRLVSVKDGGTVVASYTYDGLTRRLTKTNAAAETRHYFYNNDWRALEERVEGVSGVERQYTWGLRDRWDLLRRKRSVSGLLDETLYILKNYLDPVAIVDDSGTVVERYAYDAFGNVRFLAPDYASRSTSDFDWDFLFHAEFLDADTGIYNYGYRYYSPSLGRWLTRDPIGEGGGLNRFSFVSNVPISALDLLGLLVPNPGTLLGAPAGPPGMAVGTLVGMAVAAAWALLTPSSKPQPSPAPTPVRPKPKPAKACCCECVTQIHITEAIPFSQGGVFGHKFSVQISMVKFFSLTPGATRLDWWERSDRPPGYYEGAKGWRWLNLALDSGAQSFFEGFTDYTLKSRAITCPGMGTFSIYDTPQAALGTDRILEFWIAVKNPPCCQKDRIGVYAREVLGSQGNEITRQYFRVLGNEPPAGHIN